MKFLLLLKENENYKINLEFCVLFLISYLIIILMMKIMRIMRKIFVRIDFISFLSYIRQLVRFTRKDLQTITNVDIWVFARVAIITSHEYTESIPYIVHINQCVTYTYIYIYYIIILQRSYHLCRISNICVYICTRTHVYFDICIPLSCLYHIKRHMLINRSIYVFINYELEHLVSKPLQKRGRGSDDTILFYILLIVSKQCTWYCNVIEKSTARVAKKPRFAHSSNNYK